MNAEETLVDFQITRGPIRGKDRNRVGLLVRIKVRRDIEDFMSSLGGGRTMPVDSMNDSWQNVYSENSLEFYETDSRFEPNRPYSLDHIGGALFIQQADARRLRDGLPGEEIVNLAFLRLVGVSNDSGVTVGLVGPYSNDYVNRLRSAMPKAIRQFLQDYIVPVTLNLQVISKS